MFLLFLFIFIIGSCIGSFLNVVIDRWPNNRSIIKQRSHCEFCKKKLSVFDLIPILSFILLLGKCRYCHKKLSMQYPLVEFFTGIFFVLTFIFSLPNNNILFYNHEFLLLFYILFNLIITAYFIVIFMIDLKYEIILDPVIDSAIVLTFIYHAGILLLFYFNQNYVINQEQWSAFLSFGITFLISIISGITAVLFFRFLIFVSRGKGLGTGDIKLGFWLGLLLGVKAIPGFFIGFLAGALVGLYLVLSGKKHFGQVVPLAPFLVSGTYVAYFFGDQIINWYIKTFL